MVLHSVSGRRSEEFGPPPASTEPGYPTCISGAAWVASAILRRVLLQPHPKGRQHFSLFAITQARNTCAIIVAMTPRGYREPCWALGLGDRPFSSGSIQAAPGFRDSFVLLDP